jgi:hypothetical protein
MNKHIWMSPDEEEPKVPAEVEDSVNEEEDDDEFEDDDDDEDDDEDEEDTVTD